MTEKPEKPRYMEKLLATLGWNQGTRIPLANPDNQALENLLIDRQNEIQRLKELLILRKQKYADLTKYKENVQTECQENTRLLFAYKQQLEQEVKLRQLTLHEGVSYEREIKVCEKKIKDIENGVEKFQVSIAKLLKRADELKTEVCGEKGALMDWRAAIERGSSDIAAIEQFTKQDLSVAKNLEVQRQKLKMEHDRIHDRLAQLMSNIVAKERAAETLSDAVAEGIQQRQQMTDMWAGALENLRNRDKDIRHIREDYAVLDEEAQRIAEHTREQQTFYEQHKGNNLEAERENNTLQVRLGHMRIEAQRIAEESVTLESELKSTQRELQGMQVAMTKLHQENRRIMTQQHKKDLMISQVRQRLRELKLQIQDSTDKSKTAEKRAKQLEEMLNEEERYASGLTQNQQRAMHCSFVEQQKLLELKNEEKLHHMQVKAAKLVMNKLDTKQVEIEKKSQAQKETLYTICYQLEMIAAKVMHMEGEQSERMANAELAIKVTRLKEVLARHVARNTLLERHSARLNDEMRRITREIEKLTQTHEQKQSALKSAMLIMYGGNRDLEEIRAAWRRDRVEEALVKLRVSHAARAVNGIEESAFSLDKQRVQLEAAMSERMVEIETRRDMLAVQKRALLEDCSKLKMEIKEREGRIEQLIKRYEIFIGSLGKDESGAEVSIAFFKIKFAAERAELRAKGAALDADIGRREKDVSALEATVRVVAAAHAHFVHHIHPLDDSSPEMTEVRELTARYHASRDELKELRAQVADLQASVAGLQGRLVVLQEKNKQLSSREAEVENELEAAQERRQKQEARLQNARDIVRHNARRAKKLIDGIDEWRMFQLAIYVRDYGESSYSALQALMELCAAPADLRRRFAALLAATDLQRHLAPAQRKLRTAILSIVDEGHEPSSSGIKSVQLEVEESVFSTSSESEQSGISQASGFTRRFSQFRKILSGRLQEPAILESVQEQGFLDRLYTLRLPSVEAL